MTELKKQDKQQDLTIVSDNGLIDAQDLPKLSLNARKLFYIAVSQCRMDDQEFYEFETTSAELAEMWGVSRQEVYQVAERICRELMQIVITLRSGKKSFKMRHLFDICEYNDDATLIFQLHSEMSDILLGIKKDFSKPKLWDFMRMRSPYSMAIWHLFQKEMKSFKPMMTQIIEFDISLEALRAVTGCEEKFKAISEFKRFVLDKAIKEIRHNCLVEITYSNLKRGRTITGFRFTAKSVLGYIDVSDMSFRMRKKMRKAELIRKRASGGLGPDETEELLDLIAELDQLTLEDVANGSSIE